MSPPPFAPRRGTRRPRRARSSAAALALALAASTPGLAGTPESERDARIAELEAGIASDEAALGDFLSDPERVGRLRESEELSAIAERLPGRQRELRTLREQRDQANDAE